MPPAPTSSRSRWQPCGGNIARFIVEPDGERFDGAVLAVPAPAAFSLLRPVLDRTVRPRGWQPWTFASVAVVTLASDAAAFDVLVAAPHSFAGYRAASWWRPGAGC